MRLILKGSFHKLGRCADRDQKKYDPRFGGPRNKDKGPFVSGPPVKSFSKGVTGYIRMENQLERNIASETEICIMPKP